MEKEAVHWMRHAVDLAARGTPSALKVGVVIVSAKGQMICSAFQGEVRGEGWHDTIRRKTPSDRVASDHSLYLTVNTLGADGRFDLTKLLQSLQAECIYVGLPDPGLGSYREDDPVFTRGSVRRFPDDMQQAILEQNWQQYRSSDQSIQCNTHYSTHRIGELLHSSLRTNGIVLSRSEVNANRKPVALASLVSEKYGVGYEDARLAIQESLSLAFDKKYGSYDDMHDARSANSSWTREFSDVHKATTSAPLSESRIVNVGVGAGSEAAELFSDCSQVTFVDIAESGLKNVQKSNPLARTVVASADDMPALSDDSYDLYISLRTYNSSFFDVSAAASEARRVLTRGGVLIVSVANGFLHTGRDRVVVPGLILPGTEFVDLYRGMDTARDICNELTEAGFKNVRMTPASTEIFLTAVAE